MGWLIVVCGLLVAGCTNAPKYQKQGADEETFQRDFAECRMRMNQTPESPSMNAFGNLAIAMQVRDDCMRAKGYVRVQ